MIYRNFLEDEQAVREAILKLIAKGLLLAGDGYLRAAATTTVNPLKDQRKT